MKSKIKGCMHHESKVISKFSDGGKVEKKLKTKTMSDGSQQWTRGDTKSERMGNIAKAVDVAVENYRAADDEVDANIGKPGFDKAMDKSKRLFKGRRQLGRAFMNELEDGDEK